MPQRFALLAVLLAALSAAAQVAPPAVPGPPGGRVAPPATVPLDSVIPPLGPDSGLPRGVPVPGLLPGPGGIPANELFLPEGSIVTMPFAKKQALRFSPRYGVLGNFERQPESEPGVQQMVYTAGLIIEVTHTVDDPTGGVEYRQYEFATDNLVMWMRGADAPANPAAGLSLTPGAGGSNRIELYMKGNVVIRSKDSTKGADGKMATVTRTLRADAIYYDIDANKAIALNADLEVGFSAFPDTVHMTGLEIARLGRDEWKLKRAAAFTSKLPSDPAVQMLASEATYRETTDPRRNFLGLKYRNPFGSESSGYERTLTATNARIAVLGVPVFYTPILRTSPEEPLGPLAGVGFGNDTVFGTQLYSTWDIYKLLALRAPNGHNWRLHADHLSDRGTAFGTDYNFTETGFFGYGGPASGDFKFYGLNDEGIDNLGPRGPDPYVQDYRFRAYARYQQELYAEREPRTLLNTGPQAFLQTQFAWLSDKNFHEQYFNSDFQTGVNQETFALLAGTAGPWYGSVLVQGGEHRDWITETRWLPRADGALIGRSIFDTFVYNARASAGYAEFVPASVYPEPELSTEQQKLRTGRIDLIQELSAPIDLGPAKLTPYATVDLTGYSQDLNGNQTGRIWGGGGAKISTTLGKLYPGVSSELFNVRGINHKVTYSADYFIARTNVPYTSLPLLDRLNDDTTDMAYRAIQDHQQYYIDPITAEQIRTGPQFNPQQLAIRKLLNNRVDTRDDIQTVRFSSDNRLQTKRGFPGSDHIVDWFTLNLGTTLFPDAVKDNFGKSFALMEYNALWNVGDRTAIQSAGWFDPFDPGARYFNAGVYLARPDKTNFYLGYRQTDPVNSKAVMANVFYPLSRKYAVSVWTSYDFGMSSPLANSVNLVRTGTDMTLSFGFTYNPITSNFGVQFSVLPNIAAATGTAVAGGSPQLGGR